MSTKTIQAVSPTELGQVVISKEEYDGLVEDSIFLLSLYRLGVDSWEGYELALKDYEETMKDDD